MGKLFTNSNALFLGVALLSTTFTINAGAGDCKLKLPSLKEDLLLGGVNFRGQPVNLDAENKYGGKYVKPIYASELFAQLGVPTLEDYANQIEVMSRFEIPKDGAPRPGETQGPQVEQPPQKKIIARDECGQITDEVRAMYEAEMKASLYDQVPLMAFRDKVPGLNTKLSQVFVLQTIANILDLEANMLGAKTEIPRERIEYALRKILVIDTRKIGSQLFSPYLTTKMTEAFEKEGEEGLKKLAAIGIPMEIVDLFRGKGNQKQAKQVFENFRKNYYAAILDKISKGESLEAYGFGEDLTEHFRLEFDMTSADGVFHVSVAMQSRFESELFADFVRWVIKAYPKKLLELGITAELKDYYNGMYRETPDMLAKANRFRERLTARMRKIVSSKNRDAGVIPYGELEDEYVRFFSGEKVAPPPSWILFERLKLFVGSNPFAFRVRWKPGVKDGPLMILGDELKKDGMPWVPLTIAGQAPMNGAPDAFPASLAELRRRIQAEAAKIHKAYTRRLVANTWLLRDWRNRDLRNPYTGLGYQPRHESEMYNPLGQISMIDVKELENAYNEIKDEVAATYEVTEIVLGAKSGKKTKPDDDDEEYEEPALAPENQECVNVFRGFFEKAYAAKQREVVNALNADLDKRGVKRDDIRKAMNEAGLMLPELYSEAIFAPTLTLAKDQFELAIAQTRAFKDEKGAQSCANFSARVDRHEVTAAVTAAKKAPSASELARAAFVNAARQTPQLRTALIPYKSTVDEQGNAHHYFLHRVKRAKMKFLTTEDREVRLSATDLVLERRLAERLMASVSQAIGKRYSIGARTEEFSWNGVSGFKIREVVTEHQKWLPQIFGNRSSRLFEQAYTMP